MVKEWQQPDYAPKFKGFGTLYITHGNECHMVVERDGCLNCSNYAIWRKRLIHAFCSMQAMQHWMGMNVSSSSHRIQILQYWLVLTAITLLQDYSSAQGPNRDRGTLLLQQSAGHLVRTCEALPGMHAFTGSDSISAFVGKGKKQAFWLMVLHAVMCNAMKMVGSSFDADDDERLCSVCLFAVGWTQRQWHQSYSLQIFLQQECTNMPSSINQRCTQVPCGPCKLPGMHIVIIAGCWGYHTKPWWPWLDAEATIPSPDGHGWMLRLPYQALMAMAGCWGYHTKPWWPWLDAQATIPSPDGHGWMLRLPYQALMAMAGCWGYHTKPWWPWLDAEATIPSNVGQAGISAVTNWPSNGWVNHLHQRYYCRMSCNCSTGKCVHGQCSRYKTSLPFTDACGCYQCENTAKTDQTMSSDDGHDVR